jgi:hypothetical protein
VGTDTPSAQLRFNVTGMDLRGFENAPTIIGRCFLREYSLRITYSHSTRNRSSWKLSIRYTRAVSNSADFHSDDRRAHIQHPDQLQFLPTTSLVVVEGGQKAMQQQPERMNSNKFMKLLLSSHRLGFLTRQPRPNILRASSTSPRPST